MKFLILKTLQRKFNALLAMGLMLCSASVWSAEPTLIEIEGFPGLSSAVSWKADKGNSFTLTELEDSIDFMPLKGVIEGFNNLSPVWLRIDIKASESLASPNAYLQIKPSYLLDLRLVQADADEQRSGLGLAFNEHSLPFITPTFSISLKEPTTRVYLRLTGASLRITQLKLLSPKALGQVQQNEARWRGFFMGAMLLMLLLTLLNWGLTRDLIYRSYANFLASGIMFFLITTGFVTAYALDEHPYLAILLTKLCASWSVASTIFISVLILQVDQVMPLMARGLRWLAWLLIICNLVIYPIALIPGLLMLHIAGHLVAGVLLLSFCVRQAWLKPSLKNYLLFSSFLIFTLFDKYPLIYQLGLGSFQITDWLFDTRMIGYLFQLLPMHLMILAQLREQQKMKAASDSYAQSASNDAYVAQLHRSELTRFLGMIGHEIRTPLAEIDSAVQSLELQTHEADAARISRHVRIRKAVKKLDLLISDTMQRERIESTGWQLNYAKLTSHELLDVVLARYEIEPHFNPSPTPTRFPVGVSGQLGWLEVTQFTENPEIEADFQLLKIALTNLLDNAFKYAEPGSTVKLNIDLHRPTFADAVELIRIDVVSFGPVLTAQDGSNIFIKYWRHEDHHDIGGTGLGLPLVRHIMQLHRGSAEVHILPDRWTCFTLQLPTRRA